MKLVRQSHTSEEFEARHLPVSASSSVRLKTMREGSGFGTEQELVCHIRELFALGESSEWTWLDELDSLSGIADLAAVQLRNQWQSSASIGEVPTRWIYTLTCLPFGQPMSDDSLASIANITPRLARNVFQFYTRAGFCTLDRSSNRWIKTCQPLPVAQKIIAIEAKLHDWHRALRQACRYADYASECWVVLCDTALPRALLHIDEFIYRGVGLIGLSPLGEFTIASTAEEKTPRLANRYWQANAEIARRLWKSRFEVAAEEAVSAV